jgi:hypothetical protein
VVPDRLRNHSWQTMRSAVALALLWGILPAIPSLLQGGLLGSPHTDLYPSVWSLWACWQQSTDWLHTGLLNFPDGSRWYPPSPIKSLLAGPLLMILPLHVVYNVLTIAARVATVVCAYKAAKAWSLTDAGALTAAAIYGCSPFFHGFAAEGIIEGTDGWALALWALAAGRNHRGGMAAGLALSVLSSWYMGACCCLLAILSAVRDRRALWSFAGLIPAAPFIWSFFTAWPEMQQIPSAVRLAMSAQPELPTPNLLDSQDPAAMNTYIGWVAIAASLFSRKRWILFALIPGLLSAGVLRDLPLLELLRFPYRWHAATLAILALGAGSWASQRPWLGWLIAAEGLLLSSVPLLLPPSNADVDEAYLEVSGPILDIPGPVQMPPGVHNPSRRRAGQWLYAQTLHGQALAWEGDFNGLGQAPSGLRIWRSQDPLWVEERISIDEAAVQGLERVGIRYIAVHGPALGTKRTADISEELENAGAERVDTGGRVLLFRTSR